MPRGEDVGGGKVALGELRLFRPGDLEDLARVVVEVSSRLVAQVGRRFAVAYDLDGVVYPDGAVVGGDDDGVSPLGKHLEDGVEVGVFEPGAGEGAEGRFVFGKLADDLRFRPRMRQDVEEVVDDHREIGVVDVPDVVDEPPARFGAYEFVERRPPPFARRLQLAHQELLLVFVFASLLVVVQPAVGHELVDGQRHQPGEEGVAGVLGGCGEDAAVEIFRLDVIVVVQQ